MPGIFHTSEFFNHTAVISAFASMNWESGSNITSNCGVSAKFKLLTAIQDIRCNWVNFLWTVFSLVQLHYTIAAYLREGLIMVIYIHIIVFGDNPQLTPHIRWHFQRFHLIFSILSVSVPVQFLVQYPIKVLDFFFS